MAFPPSPLRVLIVDDNERVRHGIAAIVKEHCEVCGEAVNGAEAVEMVRDLSPDVVLLDLSMPVLDGADAAEAIRAISPETRIVFISVDDSPSVAKLVKAARADGFISKNCGPAAFRETIDMILHGSRPSAA